MRDGEHVADLEVVPLGLKNCEAEMEGLLDLLHDAVEDGASVGFLAPLDRELATAYWQRCGAEADDGRRLLLTAFLSGRLVGSVQLSYASQQNGRHRAEVQRLLVHRDARRLGIGTRLVQEAERLAKCAGTTLLFLNTRTGDPPERLYANLGYAVVGTIPDFAQNPDGTLNTTTLMYKRLP